MSDWVSHLDEGSGHVYYQNNVTGETTWDKPEGFDDSLAATSSDIPEWSEVMDPGSGHSYYYNNITGESSWDKPAGFDAKKSHDMEAKMEKQDGKRETPQTSKETRQSFLSVPASTNKSMANKCPYLRPNNH